MPRPTTPPHRRVLGIETEYGLSFDGDRTQGMGTGAEALLRHAIGRLRHLPCMNGGGLWLENGARFYIDCGSHPEYCTPETEHPIDTMRHVLAGDLVLSRLLSEINGGANAAGWRLFKCNVDYSGTHSTWACHESYSSRKALPQVAEDLVPHLVSRIIYTGAGGLNPNHAGIEFCLSPRVFHIRQLSSGSSTGARGILHEKDESLASGGLHRLHILCGDSVMSHRAGILKVGATALVLALSQAGRGLGQELQLADPVAAFHAFNRDPSLQACAQMRSGVHRTALDIQRAWLRAVQEHLDLQVMPDWAPALCALWNDTLNRLEQGPAGVMTSLDWGIKWALYRHFAQERGFPLDSFTVWNRRTAGTLLAQPEGSVEEGPPSIPIPGLGRVRWRQASDLKGKDREFMTLRHQLCEAEIKFSRLGGDGLFETMDRAGQLDHRVPGLTPASVEEATRSHEGPGRARLRSLFVRKYGGKSEFACDWSMLARRGHTWFDLSNPFQDRFPRPRPVPSPDTMIPPSRGPRWLDSLWTLFSQGQYAMVERELGTRSRLPRLSAMPDFIDYLLLNVRLHSRLGAYPRALEFLHRWSVHQTAPMAIFLEHVSLYRFQGLQPMFREAASWIEQADRLPEGEARQDASRLFAYHCHKAHILGHSGRQQESLDLLQRTLADASLSVSHPRLFSRALCDLADLYRCLDQPGPMEECLRRAADLYRMNDLPGDHAEFHQVTTAKCSAALNPDLARQTLRAARDQALANGSPMGQARVVALEARLAGPHSPSAERRELLLRLRQAVPALSRCPLLQRILDDWEGWTTGAQPEGETDPFWNV